jgi:hypothetical protein
LNGKTMIRAVLTIVSVIFGLILVMLQPASAQNLPIEAFFGKFSGGGVAQNADSIYFSITARDFDVEIRPQGRGFKIDWTSVIRRGGDPSNPKVRRRQSAKTLLPTGEPGVFHGSESGDPLKGKEMSWARIDGNTLTLFFMTVGKNGVYELQQYDRTLSGTGMKLLFRSWRDGDRLRSVTGKLIKTAN